MRLSEIRRLCSAPPPLTVGAMADFIVAGWLALPALLDAVEKTLQYEGELLLRQELRRAGIEVDE